MTKKIYTSIPASMMQSINRQSEDTIRENKKVCAVILAAGTSSRMGRVKQLLPLGEKKLLEHVIEKTLNNMFADVYTVIGYEAQKIKSEIKIQNRRFQWIINENYKYGQSTSLKKALTYINEKYDNVMIFLGDEPFITPETIKILCSAGRELAKTVSEPFIIRPSYKNHPGHPVFIGNITKHEINLLEGDSGFKSLQDVFSVKKFIPVEDEGIIYDIDTEENYRSAIIKSRLKNLE